MENRESPSSQAFGVDASLGCARPKLSGEAFASRFREAQRKLWWVAASVLGRREQVDDVLQEAALIAISKLDEFDPDTSFEAWMAQIVRFVALNDARKRSRRSTMTGTDLPEAAAATGHAAPSPIRPDGSILPDQSAFDDSILHALNDLPEVARTCLLLRAVEGLSYKEIAEMLSVPEGTAMSHVHRARTSMRNALAKEGRP